MMLNNSIALISLPQQTQFFHISINWKNHGSNSLLFSGLLLDLKSE